MRRVALISSALALAVLFGTATADAGIIPKVKDWVSSELENYEEAAGIGYARVKEFVTTQVGLLPGDNPGIAIENNATVIVTGPPVVVYPNTTDPFPAANPFASSGPTGTSFGLPVTGCGGSLGFSGYIHAGAYNPGAGNDVQLLFPIQVPPGTPRSVVAQKIKEMRIGSGVLDASFNIKAELHCSVIDLVEYGDEIPVMSAWGFVALVGLLLGAGSWVLYRRRRGIQPA